ncbi:EAL domain-containing protein [Chromobacterium paludis]|uniref:cyclic-guanylate-specific phosphodiesterase n=1 Tax=Chromobacterium paludis TaxID=2605945 RepID=A0A5C1DKE4_9NEIS|nr:cyclic diguanylate phosphodiesterase [Chromobacterium paludis]QEL57226.1 cyclic diguanylate phosphodiesterase [Chromobacterium paludis]
MNPLHPRRQHRLSHLLASLLVAALPLLAIAPTLLWQEKRDLAEQARRQAEQARSQLDEILDQAALASRAIQPLAGSDCASAAPELRRQATIVPFVRSTGLLRDGAIYCTSLSGAIPHPKPYSSPFVGGALRLLPGNRTTPDVPLMHFRTAGPHGDTLAAVDGRYLQLALQDASDGAPVYLIVGGQWLGPRLAGAGQPPLPAQIQIRLSSTRYPYAVATGYALPGNREWLWRRHAALLLVVVALSLLAGGALYWLLGRPASPSDELRRALENDEFEGFLQPLVKPGQAGWQGAETLMRWRHPREGLVRPDLFIPRAEESGLIVPMTRGMMDRLIPRLAPLRLPAGFHLGFNISRAHLDDPGFFDDCARWQRALAARGAVLTLELTEREIIAITPEVEALFQRLHALGAKIALDDFGTGHSSLVYLQQLAVDGLKIDQSFVAGIGSDGLSAHIVDSVAELAAKLGLDTVAEGVETAAQFDYLAQLGVGWLQGYHIARPMPLDEFIRRWRAGDTWNG